MLLQHNGKFCTVAANPANECKKIQLEKIHNFIEIHYFRIYVFYFFVVHPVVVDHHDI